MEKFWFALRHFSKIQVEEQRRTVTLHLLHHAISVVDGIPLLLILNVAKGPKYKPKLARIKKMSSRVQKDLRFHLADTQLSLHLRMCCIGDLEHTLTILQL